MRDCLCAIYSSIDYQYIVFSTYRITEVSALVGIYLLLHHVFVGITSTLFWKKQYNVHLQTYDVTINTYWQGQITL